MSHFPSSIHVAPQLEVLSVASGGSALPESPSVTLDDPQQHRVGPPLDKPFVMPGANGRRTLGSEVKPISASSGLRIPQAVRPQDPASGWAPAPVAVPAPLWRPQAIHPMMISQPHMWPGGLHGPRTTPIVPHSAPLMPELGLPPGMQKDAASALLAMRFHGAPAVGMDPYAALGTMAMATALSQSQPRPQPQPASDPMQWFTGHSLPLAPAVNAGSVPVQTQDYSELFCICQQPYKDGQLMICCDGCEDWFHPGCMGLSDDEAERMETFLCAKCQRKPRRVAATAAANRMREAKRQAALVKEEYEAPRRRRGSTSRAWKTQTVKPRKRKPYAVQACDLCRQRKRKCDNQRPCGPCAKRHMECTTSRAKQTLKKMRD